MKSESGLSMVEIIGVLAIGGILMAGVIARYNIVRNRQIRTIAVANLEQIAKDTKLLMSPRGSYAGASVDYLIKAGALKNNRAPIGSADWSIVPGIDGMDFSINLTGLSRGECEYFTSLNIEWAEKIKVNNYETDPGSYCLSSGDNNVSFIVE